MFRAADVLMALLIVLAATPSLAQTAATGAVTGTVRDQTGSMVPEADVSIRNTATNETRQVKSQPDGTFVFPLLPPGDYVVQVVDGRLCSGDARRRARQRDGDRQPVHRASSGRGHRRRPGLGRDRDCPVELQHAGPGRRLAVGRGPAARHAELHADHHALAGHHGRRHRRRQPRSRQRRDLAAQRARQSLVRQQLPDERPGRERHLLAGDHQRRRADSEPGHHHGVQGADRAVRRGVRPQRGGERQPGDQERVESVARLGLRVLPRSVASTPTASSPTATISRSRCSTRTSTASRLAARSSAIGCCSSARIRGPTRPMACRAW